MGTKTVRGEKKRSLSSSRPLLLSPEHPLPSGMAEQILKAVSDPIMVIDRDFRIVWMNEPSALIHRQSLPEVKGHHCYETFKENPKACADCPVAETLRTGLTFAKESFSDLCNGRETWIESYTWPILNPQGEVLYAVYYFRDITPRKSIEKSLKVSFENLRVTLGETVNALASTVEKRDPYTAGHQKRVAQLAVAIAGEMNLPPQKTEGVRVAALLHDIGKIYIPTEILNKPGKLSQLEMSLIQTHCEVGYEILKKIPFSWPVAQAALQHQERMNGSGYPAKLRGEKILLEARIIGVADVVEGMSSHRPYRPALALHKAIEEISRHRGILFDAGVVDACLRLFKEKNFAFEEL